MRLKPHLPLLLVMLATALPGSAATVENPLYGDPAHPNLSGMWNPEFVYLGPPPGSTPGAAPAFPPRPPAGAGGAAPPPFAPPPGPDLTGPAWGSLDGHDVQMRIGRRADGR